MELILDSAERTAFKDIITKIFRNKENITELKIAMAYNHAGGYIDEIYGFLCRYRWGKAWTHKQWT